ncbi:hypothetical protein, partial [Lactobacillus nasalidis]
LAGLLLLAAVLHFLPAAIYRYGSLAWLRFLILAAGRRKLPAYTGLEKDYPARLAESYQLDYGRTARMQLILLQDRFSPRKAAGGDLDFVRSFWSDLRGAVYRTAPWWRKLLWKLLGW